MQNVRNITAPTAVLAAMAEPPDRLRTLGSSLLVAWVIGTFALIATCTAS